MSLFQFKKPLLVFLNVSVPGIEPVYNVDMSESLAVCIQELRKYMGGGIVKHLGIGVSRKYPRRANGKPIIRYVNNRRVLTGHYQGLPEGPCAIDATEWAGADARFGFTIIHQIAKDVAKDHPEWRMSVVLEPGWVHIEVSYPHLEEKP